MRSRRLDLALLVVLLVAPAFAGCMGGHASDWAYKMVGIRKVQEEYTGDEVITAIIDTGIDANHTSLDHTKIIWKDFVSGKPGPYDDVGHGTHVAGILAGKGAAFGGRLQGFDLKGAIIADHPTLIVGKAIKKDESGDATWVANGITFAVQNKAEVICLSLGSRPDALTPVLSQASDVKFAIESAINQGIFVVASAGNVKEGQSSNDVAFPASLENVIAVGAVTEAKKVASFSARGSEDANQGPAPLRIGGRADPGKKPEIVAPGENIKSAWKDGGYAIAKGTSQAAPFVCGALALLLHKCPSLRATNNADMVKRVKSALMETAEKISGQRKPHDPGAGYGLLRADLLLEKFPTPC